MPVAGCIAMGSTQGDLLAFATLLEIRLVDDMLTVMVNDGHG